MKKDTNKDNKIRTARGAIMADKKICDLTYGKIAVECHFDKAKNQRYIKKSEVNMTNWALSLGLKDYRTLNTRLKYLIKIGLVKEEAINGTAYYVLPAPTEHFLDIEEKTFKQLVASCHKNLLRVYLCLVGWNHYCQKRNTKFQFSLDSLNRELNLTVNSANREATGHIIDTLERLGLIELADKQVRVGKGFRYELKNAYDRLPDKSQVKIERTTREKRKDYMESVAEAVKTDTVKPTPATDNGFTF